MMRITKPVYGRAITAVLAVFVVLGTGCMLGPKFNTPEVPTAEQWRETGQPQFAGQPVDQIEWWKSLNDPILNSLIEEAFKENLTLQAASLRIVEARIARSAAGLYTFIPFITGGGSISHNNFSTNARPSVEIHSNKNLRSNGGIGDPLRDQIRNEIRSNMPTISVTPEMDVYDAGFDATYELDLWGKKRQLLRGTGEQINAAYAGYDDVRVSLAAEVARTYVLIRTTNQRIGAMNELFSTMDQFVKLTEDRYAKKLALITDVKLAKLLKGIVKSSIPKLESARRQYENSLCILLGRAPQALDKDINTTGPVPVTPLQSLVGIPADLLRRRPDVRMAEHMAAVHCARVGMAKANIMPSFNIFGSIGLTSSDSDNFFHSDSVRSAYGGLVGITQLINYPLTVKSVRLEDAQFEQALLQYRDTVLQANMEVENSMYSYLQAQDELAILEDNVKNAQDTAQLTLAAYQEGKVIVSVPLVALTFLASQQDQMWEWRGETTTSYIAIYKALGGGWQNRVDQELVSDSIRENMKKQADWWSFTGKHDLATKQVINNGVKQDHR